MAVQILDILELPEEHAALGRWLDGVLVGPNLPAIIEELQAVHGTQAAPSSLEEIVGSAWQSALDRGTSAFSSSQMQALLRNAGLLLELQEKVLTEGGAYWDQLLGSDSAIDAATVRGRWRLRTASALRDAGSQRTSSVPTSPSRWFARPWVVSLATAAAVLIVLGSWRALSPRGAETAWGWQKPGVLANDVNAPAYLARLADSADEWFAKKPATEIALADRLSQLRRGCTNLILATHEPLTPEDRQWLKQKCQAWAHDIDQRLSDLESGKPMDQVESDADATVHKLAHALRDRADKAGQKA